MPNVSDVLAWSRPSRALPQPVSDGSVPGALTRASRYGELLTSVVVPTKHNLADEGSYFATTNPTPNSVLAFGSGGTQATFSDTIGFMLIKNNDAAGGKRICLDYLKFQQIGGTAVASSTSVQYAIVVDSKARDATAGTAATHTPVNVNMDSTNQSVGQVIVYTGAVPTHPARSSAARLASKGVLKGGPALLLDEYGLAFGVPDSTAQGGYGYLTTVASYVTHCPPVIIGPGQNALIHLWFIAGATNPFSYEYEMGWWER